MSLPIMTTAKIGFRIAGTLPQVRSDKILHRMKTAFLFRIAKGYVATRESCFAAALKTTGHTIIIMADYTTEKPQNNFIIW